MRQGRKAEQMRAHLQHDDRQRQHRRKPKPPCHVGEFAAIVLAASFGFERHAADRASARTGLADLRMHRAGVDRAFRLRPCRRLRGAPCRYFSGSAMNLFAATGAAEVVDAVSMRVAVRRRRGIDLHAADRIGHGHRLAVRMSLMLHAVRLETVTP